MRAAVRKELTQRAVKPAESNGRKAVRYFFAPAVRSPDAATKSQLWRGYVALMEHSVFGRAREKRRARRRPGSTRAILAFNKGAAVLGCSVRDFSSTGARVWPEKKVPVPDTVYLVFPDSWRAYHANVRWRNETAVGLDFLGVVDLTGELSLDLRFLKWVASDHRSTARA